MNFLATFDDLAEASQNPFARVLDRLSFGGLLLMTVAAPHSIAITQIAWLIGMLAWIVRLFLSPRPKVTILPIGFALIALFAWSAISSVFSYEPAVSLDKLRGAALFLIFIFAFNVLRNRRAVHLFAFLLIGSCMFSVAWTPIQQVLGRGVAFSGLTADSPIKMKGGRDGDVIVRANGEKVDEPEDVISKMIDRQKVVLEMNRLDGVYWIELQRTDLLSAPTAAAQLGFVEWKRGRGFRATGFYGHFTTYAEVLQLIGALAFGLLVAAWLWGRELRTAVALAVCVSGIAFAILLTVTRASQLALVISSMSIVMLAGTRKFILISVGLLIPVVLLGLSILQQQRQVGFLDSNDGSIQYRQMMWRDGVRLLKERPSHLVVGIGMDSIKKRWEEFKLFDKGWQPMGHFHSTPLQLAVERGIPALIIWFGILTLLARTLWKGTKQAAGEIDWATRGVALGCLGALIGFFVSGLVHYNLGDQEVAMVFFLLMAFAVRLSYLGPAEDILLADSPILRPSV